MWFSRSCTARSPEPAGLLTPCRYRAPGGRVVPLQHEPLNDPTLCARPLVRPRPDTGAYDRDATGTDPAPHTPAATRSQGLAPFPATGQEQYSGAGDLGAFEAVRNLQSVAGQGSGGSKFETSRRRTSRLLPVAQRWGCGRLVYEPSSGSEPLGRRRRGRLDAGSGGLQTHLDHFENPHRTDRVAPSVTALKERRATSPSLRDREEASASPARPLRPSASGKRLCRSPEGDAGAPDG